MDKKILEIADVSALQPDLKALVILDEEKARDAQVVIFSQKGTKLELLTTNNFSLKVKAVTDELVSQGYSFDLYYTSTAAFGHALEWYDRRHAQQDLLAQQAQQRATVVGQDALGMMRQLYEQRNNYTASDFVMELVRL